VIIAHGSSKARAIAAACELAWRLAGQDIVSRIGDRMAALPRSHRLW